MTPRGFSAPTPLLVALAWLLAACAGLPPPSTTVTRPSDATTVPRTAAPAPAATTGTTRPGAPGPGLAAPSGTSIAPAASGAPSAGATAVPATTAGFAPVGPTEAAVVVRVVDGDTIVVDRGSGPERLRYIGVDTPETVDPRRPVEWMGREASRANAELVEGRQVVLERDVSDRDRYDRLLRYVWLHDGSSWMLVNLELVRLGFAQVVTYPPDVRYVERYLEAQAEAREAGRGLWSVSADAVPSEPAPSGEAAPNRAGCEPAYPGVCIPPPPPDLDCGDIPARRFEVIAPDPHRFDGDGDGIGCEGG